MPDNIDGLIIGLFAFCIIGVFHPVVIKCEYYFSKKIWPAFLVAGLFFGAVSLNMGSLIPRITVGILCFTCFWSIKELFEQEKRVAKGWFPKNPGRKEKADESSIVSEVAENFSDKGKENETNDKECNETKCEDRDEIKSEARSGTKPEDCNEINSEDCTENAEDKTNDKTVEEIREDKKESASPQNKKSFLITLGVLGAAAAVAVFFFNFYHGRFLPFSKAELLNSGVTVDLSNKTPAEAQKLVSDKISSLEFEIYTRAGGISASGGELGLYADEKELSEELSSCLEKYRYNLAAAFSGSFRITPEIKADNDERDIEEIKDRLLNPEKKIYPESAHISEYIPGRGYEIVKEVEGNSLKHGEFEKFLKEEIYVLNTEINAPERLYAQPEVRADDEALNEKLEKLNSLVNREIRLVADGEGGENIEELLSGELLHEWIWEDENGVSINGVNVGEYCDSIAEKYASYEFSTGNESTKLIINTREFKDKLYSRLNFLNGADGEEGEEPEGEEEQSNRDAQNTSGEIETAYDSEIPTVETMPVETREAEEENGEADSAEEAGGKTENNSKDNKKPEEEKFIIPMREVDKSFDPAYGELYVDISLSDQRVRLFENGNVAVDTPCVTGNVARGHSTPPGVFKLAYKQRNRILRGAKRPDGSYEYESFVNFWMPFNGGIGLHDAGWRGSFGGNIYKYSGSHGCVNMPYNAAKAIYEKIDKGVTVYVH